MELIAETLQVHTLSRIADFFADKLAFLAFGLVILGLVMFDLRPSIVTCKPRSAGGEGTATVAHHPIRAGNPLLHQTFAYDRRHCRKLR